jgi:hypothetical protein
MISGLIGNPIHTHIQAGWFFYRKGFFAFKNKCYQDRIQNLVGYFVLCTDIYTTVIRYFSEW